MRVLIVVRPTALASPGGDSALADHAVSSLRARGVDVDLVASLTPDARGYDVAHVYGIFDPNVAEPQIAAIRQSCAALVISPIWWDRIPLFLLAPRLERVLAARDLRSADARIARLRRHEPSVVRGPSRGARRHTERQAAALRRCDLAFTGSTIEAYACARELGVDEVPYVVAHYGLEPAAFAAGPERAPRSGVVCVGRLEPLKNQALLLYALRELDVDVTLVGSSKDARYSALCRRLATPRTHFVDRLALNDLRALLSRSAVHVLPSWGDLPGFVSLEAAALGARVIAGARGSEREYLGPDADYVDPLAPEAIRAAVARAIAAPAREPNDAFDARLRTLTWDTYADASLDAYRRACERIAR